MNDEAPRDIALRRLWWRSRRGLRELDLLLLPFVEDQFAGLDEAQQDLYLRLVEHEDQDLLMWFTDRAVPLDRDLIGIIDLIRRTRRPIS